MLWARQNSDSHASEILWRTKQNGHAAYTVSHRCIVIQEAAAADIDFSIEQDKETGEDLVVIREQRMPSNHLATLAKHIVRFEQITADMDAAIQPQSMTAQSSVAAR